MDFVLCLEFFCPSFVVPKVHTWIKDAELNTEDRDFHFVPSTKNYNPAEHPYLN
jgi:hypothetical protein